MKIPPGNAGGYFFTMKEYSNSAITVAINEWIHNAKHRAILIDRYVNGLTFEKLAEEHDLSVRHVKTIVYKAEQQLAPHIK